MTIDRVIGPVRPVNLGQLTEEVRAALGDGAITGLSMDRENVTAHFTQPPTERQRADAEAALIAHVPVWPAEPPTAEDVATLLENATSFDDLKAALLAAFGKG